MASGIYVIHNTKNGWIYLGQAIDITKRWNTYRSNLKNRHHPNRYLQAAWDEFGAKAFKFKVLEYCAVDQLTEREQHFLDIYTPKGKCYNISRNASTPGSSTHLSALYEPRFDDNVLLALLNEHVTVAKVAEIVGMSESGMYQYLKRNGFEKVVTYYAAGTLP